MHTLGMHTLYTIHQLVAIIPPFDNATSLVLQMLEYTGRSPTVGLAQTCYPLDTRNHYFEIEIVDPGKLCHIAIGVARKVGDSFLERYICDRFGCNEMIQTVRC